MNREEMIEVLIPAYVDSGKSLADARRQLWRMNPRTLQRELLLRGLQDYDEPAPIEEDDVGDDAAARYSALGCSNAPIYAD
jgi:hypothetical protein